MKQNKIYLTGFMGSGKSTLAPLIANVLGYTHFDIDAEIERETGLTIPDIFRIHGEPYFRSIEQSILLRISQHPNIVVALGGGTVTFENNLQLMKSTGLLVYLKASPETIIRRVKRKQHRPLLKDEDGTILTEEALRNRIQQLLLAREFYYSQADIVIEIGTTSLARTIDQVIRLIRNKVEEG